MASLTVPLQELGLNAVWLPSSPSKLESPVPVLRPWLVGYLSYDHFDVRSGEKCSGDMTLCVSMTALSPEMEWFSSRPYPIKDPRDLRPLPAQGLSFEMPMISPEMLSVSVLRDVFLRTVARYHSIQVMLNPIAHLFSRNGETLEEFSIRCRECLYQQVEQDVSRVRMVTNLKLEAIRNRLDRELLKSECEPLDNMIATRRMEAFQNTREVLTRMLLQPWHASLTRPIPDPLGDEVIQNCLEIQADVVSFLAGVRAHCQAASGLIEAYDIHLPLQALILHRLEVLWMSEGGTP